MPSMSLARGAETAIIPFTLIDNRIFVEANINGAGPYALIFDTGGANVLNARLAVELGLARRDPFTIGGAGAEQAQAWRAGASSVEIGSLELKDVDFIVFSLEPIKRAIGFAQLDGIIGREVLERFVVRVDYEARQLTLTEPASVPPLLLDGVEIPFEFAARLPSVAVSIDGRAGRAVIDSGDRSSLTLFNHFVESNDLRRAYQPGARMITGWGVGGPVIADVVELPRLEVAGFALDGVTTRMPIEGMGAFSGSFADASIGNGVLRRFDITFDYARRRIFLRPGAGFDAGDTLDRSGMWLISVDDASGAFVIASIVEGGPAERAGLRVDDRIVRVEGVGTHDLSLPAVRDRMAAQHGDDEIHLGLADGREITLTLRDLLVQGTGAPR